MSTPSNPSPDASVSERPRRSWGRRLWLAFFLLGTLGAGVGFVYKMYEFFWDVSGTEGFEFAGVHLVTYACVATGFIMLLAHGLLRGHFGDIEQPKYDMLERECAHDRHEFS